MDAPSDRCTTRNAPSRVQRRVGAAQSSAAIQERYPTVPRKYRLQPFSAQRQTTTSRLSSNPSARARHSSRYIGAPCTSQSGIKSGLALTLPPLLVAAFIAIRSPRVESLGLLMAL